MNPHPAISEPPCDSVLIQRKPGMTRDELEEFMNGLARYCRAYGCRLIEFIPVEILENFGRECVSGTKVTNAGPADRANNTQAAPANLAAVIEGGNKAVSSFVPVPALSPQPLTLSHQQSPQHITGAQTIPHRLSRLFLLFRGSGAESI